MFRKKEEAVEQWSLDNVKLCAGRQEEILECAYTMLMSGGILVYSTCTLRKAENHEVVERFLKEHPDFVGEALELPDGIGHKVTEQPYCLTLLPGVYNTDGFFIAKLRRVRHD